jgi:hypothetical protein
VLQVITDDYSAAPVVEINIPAGRSLSDYTSFSYDVYWTGGDITWKTIYVYAFTTAPTGPFYNAGGDCAPGLEIGSADNNVSEASADWESMTVSIDGSDLSGTVYFAFGMNSDDAEYYVDNIIIE